MKRERKISRIVEQTLEHFGVPEQDCTFAQLEACAHAKGRHSMPAAANRWHDKVIEALVRPEDSLLDLGCGTGELMARLSKKQSHCRLQGIEMDEDKVNLCIERGLPVCQADMCRMLSQIPDHSYTWAVMENTLQTLHRPLDAVEQMLRIAEKSVIAFPNFAHWSARLAFGLGGRMPVTKALPLKWYDTPNIHFCSISDFQDVIRERRWKLVDAWVLIEGRTMRYEASSEQNFTAEQAMFILSR